MSRLPAGVSLVHHAGMTSTLRVFGLCASLLPLACSDDGVPADETSGGSTGGSSGMTSDITGTTQSTTFGTTAGDSTGPATATATAGDTTGTATTDASTGGDASSGSDTTAGGSSGVGSSGSSSDGSSSGGESSSGGSGTLEIGDECSADGECISGVCWDFNHYDNLCFGTACSGECSNDDDCVALMTDAGAPYPEGSSCGGDGRCSVVGTGFGSFACASPVRATAAVGR